MHFKSKHKNKEERERDRDENMMQKSKIKCADLLLKYDEHIMRKGASLHVGIYIPLSVMQ